MLLLLLLLLLLMLLLMLLLLQEASKRHALAHAKAMATPTMPVPETNKPLTHNILQLNVQTTCTQLHNSDLGTAAVARFEYISHSLRCPCAPPHRLTHAAVGRDKTAAAHKDLLFKEKGVRGEQGGSGSGAAVEPASARPASHTLPGMPMPVTSAARSLQTKEQLEPSLSPSAVASRLEQAAACVGSSMGVGTSLMMNVFRGISAAAAAAAAAAAVQPPSTRPTEQGICSALVTLFAAPRHDARSTQAKQCALGELPLETTTQAKQSLPRHDAALLRNLWRKRSVCGSVMEGRATGEVRREGGGWGRAVGRR